MGDEPGVFHWWQHGTIYEIYPRSFMDSNGDGIGDLRGIKSRLDYLTWLGVDAIWICPIYPSPMSDFGYDVSNYCDVDPLFGTLAEFDDLLAAAHTHGLKVILDFVPNHTSEQHPWFLESRRSRDDPKRDWYIWSDPARDGGPPTNWLSEFGGPAWTRDERTGQYYYHAFLPQQPDLNWRNPGVRAAMYDVLRFWLARGVDGFRVDTIHHLIKDEQLRDNPPNPQFQSRMPPHRRVIRTYTTDRPEVQDAIAEMRRVLDEFPGRVLIGEVWLPFERLVAYYGRDLPGFHLPFNFHLIGAPWNSEAITTLARDYEAALPENAWPNWVLGNHDRQRIASRVGIDQARVAAMLLLTLRGTPTLYYGDELGMQDVHIPAEFLQDPWEKNVSGLGLGRDPVRTPMQWDATSHAGFSNAATWLPIASNFRLCNVEIQRDNPHSLLTLYRTLLHLRRREPALAQGTYKHFDVGPRIFAYERRFGERCIMVALNLTSDPVSLNSSDVLRRYVVLLSTHLDREAGVPIPDCRLRSNEGLILLDIREPGK